MGIAVSFYWSSNQNIYFSRWTLAADALYLKNTVGNLVMVSIFKLMRCIDCETHIYFFAII